MGGKTEWLKDKMGSKNVNDDKAKKQEKVNSMYFDYCSLPVTDMRRLANGTMEERQALKVPVDEKLTKEQILKPEPMGFFAELACILLLGMGVPNGVFTIPAVVSLIGKFVVGDLRLTWIVFGVMLLPLAILPQPFVPSMLQSWMAIQIVKYFSFRFIYEELPKSKKDPDYHPQIMVAPPHGVFPYGNILAILIWPSLCGETFRGIASSAALRPPIFKQILRSIGIIDASRHVARKALERGESLGISTGGVAEVFETNADDECVVLKERMGMIKLAIRTGADLVPCYLFGNTDILGCWAGEGIPNGRNVLEKISRKLGFALIIIYGRFGLPIPRRVPVMGVMGKPIPTHHIKCEEPTAEQMETVQALLLDEMQDIFERYKGLYGWDEKHLIIK